MHFIMELKHKHSPDDLKTKVAAVFQLLILEVVAQDAGGLVLRLSSDDTEANF